MMAPVTARLRWAPALLMSPLPVERPLISGLYLRRIVPSVNTLSAGPSPPTATPPQARHHNDHNNKKKAAIEVSGAATLKHNHHTDERLSGALA